MRQMDDVDGMERGGRVEEIKQTHDTDSHVLDCVSQNNYLNRFELFLNGKCSSENEYVSLLN